MWRTGLPKSRRRFTQSRVVWADGKKVKSTSFDERNGNAPFNASGVAQVGPGRFVFIDNHDPSALFELALDADGTEVERISRRPMAGVGRGSVASSRGADPRRRQRRDLSHRRILALRRGR